MAPRILISQTSPLRNLFSSLLNTLLLESMFLMVTGRRLKILAPLTEIETSLALRTAAGALALDNGTPPSFTGCEWHTVTFYHILRYFP